MTTTREFDILLVEDNPVDAELVQEALKETQIPHKLDLVTNGEDALTNLDRRDVRPDLILLDLNLPKLSGFEVLATLKQDLQLRLIPVIVLTNSMSPDDIRRCYSLYANAYVRKSVGFDELFSNLLRAGHFWFEVATLPERFPIFGRTIRPPK